MGFFSKKTTTSSYKHLSKWRRFPACRSALGMGHARENIYDKGSGLRYLANEPFRFFFIVGLLAGVFGVLLWPLFYSQKLNFYPLLAHGHVMIQGFVGGFIFGFLGTAAPRMLAAPRLTTWEFLIFCFLYLASVASHLFGKLLWGNMLFLGLVILFMAALAIRRIFLSSRTPPAGFVLVGLGLMSAVVGTVLITVASHTTDFGFRYHLGQLLLFQGFVLFSILGVGSFLFSRFLHQKSRKKGRKHMPMALGAAGVLLGSFFLEALDYVCLGNALRFLIVFTYLYISVPNFWTARINGTLLLALRSAVILLLMGFLLGAIFPQFRIGMEHILFIGGFGILIFSVATRMVMGHAWEGTRFFKILKPMEWVLLILFLTLVTRLMGDLIVRLRIDHYNYAAIGWGVGSVIWLGWMAPKIFRKNIIEKEDSFEPPPSFFD